MLMLAIILSILMLLVLYFDITQFIIPNWLVGLLMAFYPALLFLSPTPIDWQMGLAAFAGSFVIGFIFFSSKIMGGGDVKLLAACCLWTGTVALAPYLLYMSVLGGLLSLLLLISRPLINFYLAKCLPDKKVPRLFGNGEPVPYGVAIAGAFLMVIWMEILPGFQF